MTRRPPRSTLTYTLLPDTTLVRSAAVVPRRFVERYRLCRELSDPVDQLRVLAARGGAGVQRIRFAVGARGLAPGAAAPGARADLFRAASRDMGDRLPQCTGPCHGCLGEHAPRPERRSDEVSVGEGGVIT